MRTSKVGHGASVGAAVRSADECLEGWMKSTLGASSRWSAGALPGPLGLLVWGGARAEGTTFGQATRPLSVFPRRQEIVRRFRLLATLETTYVHHRSHGPHWPPKACNAGLKLVDGGIGTHPLQKYGIVLFHQTVDQTRTTFLSPFLEPLLQHVASTKQKCYHFGRFSC